MTPQLTDAASVAPDEYDPNNVAVEMLMVMARLHRCGAIRISNCAGEQNKVLAEAILEGLADLADNTPACRGRTH